MKMEENKFTIGDWLISIAASGEFMCHMDIPLELLERWAKDENRQMRLVAAKACRFRKDMSLGVMEQLLTDEYFLARVAAAEACKGRNDIPIIRSFEPPERVYKKCFGGVIVEAHIPEDAQVRGKPGGKCRASKAIITEIRGDYYGKPIGISLYNKRTCYVVGEEIEIDDFDYSDEECSTGFHFFCTRKEAEEFDG